MGGMSNASRVATAIAQGGAEEAARALIGQVRAELADSPVFLALFGSMTQPLAVMAPVVAAAFPGATLVGASTAGEFTERGDAKAAASIFALAGEYRAHAGMGTGLAKDPERAVTDAISGLPLAVAG